jgi:hypothetical protein
MSDVSEIQAEKQGEQIRAAIAVLSRSEDICRCHIKPTCWRCSALMYLMGSHPPKAMISDADRDEIAAKF